MLIHLIPQIVTGKIYFKGLLVYTCLYEAYYNKFKIYKKETTPKFIKTKKAYRYGKLFTKSLNTITVP